MVKKLLLLTLLAACGVTPDQAVRWEVGVRPVATGSDPMWVGRVDAAVGVWQTRLKTAGCAVDPFDGSAGTAPVELVTADAMVAATGSSTYIGFTTHEHVLVEGTADDLTNYPTYGQRTLLHELGHALGLVHVAPATDPESIMHPGDDDVKTLDEADVADAMSAIGC